MWSSWGCFRKKNNVRPPRRPYSRSRARLVFTYDCSDFDKGRYISLAAFGLAVVMVAGGVFVGRAGGKNKQVS